MQIDIPRNLEYFIKNALTDMEDGFEYASELHRILNSDTCQLLIKPEEIEKIRIFAEKIKTIGELNYYSEKKIQAIEIEVFGPKGILHYLDIEKNDSKLKSFDDLFTF